MGGFFNGGNMRLTVFEDDPGERIVPGRERITVFLDGNEVITSSRLMMIKAK